jgi:uncharacterized protein YndB with AHSA1/START domain
MNDSDSVATPEAVVIERTIAASAERLYRAWLEPEIIQQWMEPGPFRVSRAEVDPQVGGKYRIWHAADGEERGGFESEILELVPNERIVFAWGFAGPEREEGPIYDSRLSITFTEVAANETKLTLTHDRLDALREAMPEGAANVGVGWEMVLDKLAGISVD